MSDNEFMFLITTFGMQVFIVVVAYVAVRLHERSLKR